MLNTQLSEVPITTARTAAATSAGLTATTWIAHLNELLQLGATVIAIVSGIFATWWYLEKALTMRQERLSKRIQKDD